MTRRGTTIAVVSLLLVTCASASAGELLTLAAAVELAREHNLSLAAAREDYEAARWGLRGAWASLFPSVRLSSTARRIDEETFALMTEPHIEIPVSSPPECGYGYGWRICTENVGVDHRHSGLWYGFINGIRRIPDLGLTIIILSNGHTNWIFELLRDPLVDIYREHETQG